MEEKNESTRVVLNKSYSHNGHVITIKLVQGKNTSFSIVDVDGDEIGSYIDIREGIDDAEEYITNIGQFGVGA